MNLSAATHRLERASERALSQDLDALVISPSPDLVYLTGYAPMLMERPTLLILRGGEQPSMLVPELERSLANSCSGAPAIKIEGWRDDVDPYELAAGLLPSSGRVAVADRLWSSHLLALEAVAPGLRFVPASPVMAGLRSVKDAEELDALRRAGEAADRTFAEVCGTRFAGRTEAEVASDLGRLLVDNGHAEAAFTIVASGPNSASPHHDPTARTVEHGDAVVMDFGGELEGYFSDTTRTVSVGAPAGDLVEVHAVVAAAQEAAFRAVRPGVAAEEIDEAAREVITEAGFGDRFVHRTGHGIGLEVHEHPYIVQGNGSPLEAGMTFSIEPGVYLEGRFGVRIEDIVVVTERGAERLNRSPRELLVVE